MENRVNKLENTNCVNSLLKITWITSVAFLNLIDVVVILVMLFQ